MNTKTPVWKPLLMAIVALTMCVSTAALFNAGSSAGDAFYYVCGVINLAVYIVCLVFGFKYFLHNSKAIKMNTDTVEMCYEAFSRFHQVRNLPNKSFKTCVSKDGNLVQLVADKDSGNAELIVEG